jgi:3-oxoacyl-[acyl-carrier-protein] synthase-3
MIYTKIVGTGSYAPKKILTNDDLSKIVETSDEWIFTRTGIKKRHISEGEGTTDLAEKAALKALEAAGMSANDIDLLVVATITPDHYFPATGNSLQKRLGLNEIMTFDINAACSGFLYGLEIVDKMIKSGAYKNALLIGAETLTRYTDWSDRNTCVLFGDGAGAIVVTRSETNNIIDVTTGSRTDDQGDLACQNVPLKDPFINAVVGQDHIHMNGREVFKFATKIMPETLRLLLERNNLTVEDLDSVVAHQANIRILDRAARDLGISMDKVFSNIHEYGNTSAASVPIALDEAIRSGFLKEGDLFGTVAFGGGFTWGGALIRL